MDVLIYFIGVINMIICIFVILSLRQVNDSICLLTRLNITALKADTEILKRLRVIAESNPTDQRAGAPPAPMNPVVGRDPLNEQGI